MGANSPGKPGAGDESPQLSQVVKHVIERRAAGEQVDDEAVVAAHPHLMPELQDRLRALRKVEQARQEAKGIIASNGRSPCDAETIESVPPQSVATDHPASAAQPTLADSSPSSKVAQKYPKIEGYEISGVLGQGGMAIVYRAVQRKLNRTVALKVLPAILSTASPGSVSRFRREAAAAARLHHTNIVPIYDFGESPDGYYYAMELVSGRPLDVVIGHFAEQNASSASPLRLAEMLTTLDFPAGIDSGAGGESSALATATSFSSRGKMYYRHVTRWMADAADALHYAHGQRIVHRDIKPANLILSVDGRIMIADFGLAKTEEHSVTITGSFLGTLRYVSPEQAMAKRVPVDHRTDIYSLGATMYELLCFQPAFPEAEEKEILGAIIAHDPVAPRKINPTVPAELETICLKCMEKSPTARYETARALADDLRRYSEDLPIVAKRPGPARRIAKFVKRHKAPVIAITAAVLLLATVTFLAMARTALRESRFREQQESIRAQNETVRALRESAIRSVDVHKEWDNALADLNKALEMDPDNVQTLTVFSWFKLEHFKAEPEQAGEQSLHDIVDLCRRILEINPDNVNALRDQGIALRKLKRYPQAIAALERAVELQPEDYASRSSLGSTYAEAGDLDKAAEKLREGAEIAGIEEDSWHAGTWRNLAVLELYRQQDIAVEHIANALTCDNSDALSWVVRARIGLELENHIDIEKALDDAKYADRASSEMRPKAKRVLSLAYLRNKKFSDAIEQARLAIDLGDMPTVNRLIMALAEAGRNKPIEARVHLATAGEAWPDDLRDPGTFRATAETGELWIESADQLIRMREDAIMRIGEISPDRSSEGEGRQP